MKDTKVKSSDIAFLVYDLNNENEDIFDNDNCPQIMVFSKLDEKEYGKDTYLDISRTLESGEPVCFYFYESEKSEDFNLIGFEDLNCYSYLSNKHKKFFKPEDGVLPNELLANLISDFSEKNQNMLKRSFNSLKLNELANKEGKIRLNSLNQLVDEYNLFQFSILIRKDDYEM